MSRRATKGLTPREINVANHVMLGLQHKEIANSMGIKTANLGKVVTAIYEKLGINNMVELALSWHCFKSKTTPDFDTVGRITNAYEFLKKNMKEVGAGLLVVLMCFQITFTAEDDVNLRACRTRSSRTTSRVSRPNRGNKQNLKIY